MNKPKSIKPEDVKKIMAQMNEQDKLIFQFCIESGLRISDVLNIRAWYLDEIMYVQEMKTKKHRVIALSCDLWAKLEPLKKIATQTADKSKFAFESKIKPSVSVHRSGYHKRLKKICKRLGINFSAHSSRKLFAQNLFKSTGDIFLVQRTLNHKFISDTCVYLDLDFRELIRAATNTIVFPQNSQ